METTMETKIVHKLMKQYCTGDTTNLSEEIRVLISIFINNGMKIEEVNKIMNSFFTETE